MALEKNSKFGHLPLSTSGPIDCALTGASLLNSPYLNKGSAFPPEERWRFNLTSLLPQGVQSLDSQVKRAYQQYASRADDLAKNTFLTSLKDQNEVLFYKVILVVCHAFSLAYPGQVAAKPPQGDDERCVYTNRGRCYSKLFQVVQTARRVLSQYPRPGTSISRSRSVGQTGGY